MKIHHPPESGADDRVPGSGLRPLIWVPALIAVVAGLLAIFVVG